MRSPERQSNSGPPRRIETMPRGSRQIERAHRPEGRHQWLTRILRAAHQRKFLRVAVVAALVLGSVLFIPAGTLKYWEAWLYMGVLLIPMSFAVRYLLKRSPELLERRLQTREREATQKRVIGAGWVLFLAMFILPGLDFRFGWSSVAVPVVLAADVFVLLGYGLIIRVFAENQYAARTVQVDEGQQVIKTGPYAIVRHPMYVGTLLMYLVTPLALGSVLGARFPQRSSSPCWSFGSGMRSWFSNEICGAIGSTDKRRSIAWYRGSGRPFGIGSGDHSGLEAAVLRIAVGRLYLGAEAFAMALGQQPAPARYRAPKASRTSGLLRIARSSEPFVGRRHSCEGRCSLSPTRSADGHLALPSCSLLCIDCQEGMRP